MTNDEFREWALRLATDLNVFCQQGRHDSRLWTDEYINLIGAKARLCEFAARMQRKEPPAATPVDTPPTES